MNKTPDQSQTVRLLYFAWIRERTGISDEQIELPSDLSTVRDLVTWLRTRGPEFESAFAQPEVVRAAIDQSHVKPDASIKDAREIAFFPPVTGG